VRIHRLEVTAFGPFAQREAIDFDALAAQGIFLLNGPTGAGKTSVLDAVCFALYGSLPGARLGSKAIKSHHAAADAEPSVLLEFTAQGRRFEVRRTPEWSKPSARASSGWSVQKASTHLRERIDGEWRALTARNDEAGALLGEVLGMAREQFTRVVLLPQGEFASFLRSKASERVELLEKLFGTGKFADVESEAALLAQQARSAAESAERDAAGILSQLEAEAEAAGIGQAPDGTPVPGGAAGLSSAGFAPGTGAALDTESALGRFAWARHALAERGREAAAQAEEAKAARELARRQVAEAERSLEDGAELAVARQRRDEWEADAAGQEARLAALSGHRAAAQLAALFTDADEAAAESRRALEEAAAALEAAHAAGWAGEAGAGAQSSPSSTPRTVGFGPASAPDYAANTLPSVAAVRAAAGAAASEAAVLAERVPAERELAGLEVRLAHAGTERSRLDAEAARAQAGLARLAAELDELEAERTRLEPLAAGLAVARFEEEAARAVVRAVEEHAEATRRLGAAEAEHGRARSAALDAKEEWLALRERRLNHTAAELAAQLDDGGACPVCGSTDHPAPARGAEDPLELVDAERSAADAAELAAEDERRAREALAEARALLAGVDARGGATDPDKAARVLGECIGRVEAAAEAEAARATAETRLADLAVRRAASHDALDAARTQHARAEEAMELLEAQVRRLRADVQEWRGGHATLAARQADVAARARTLDALEHSLVRHEQAEQARGRSLVRLDSALADSSFPDEGAARAALLPVAQARALEEAIRVHEAERDHLAGLFASAAVNRAVREESEGRAATREQLEARRSAAAAAEGRLEAATRAADRAEASGERCARLLAAFEDLAPALARHRDRADMLGGLARTLRGQGENTLRMSLHTYVLAARLEQVAAAATERLAAMSDGRFSLEHSDALAARGAASGLGLEVVDGWTGQRRDPSTLSGGESFMASLALALGLADVVQQEAGGIDIETLFVDEGFGSLDEQALEQVMDSIEGLRAGGRVVGLVSHVPELKQRIAAQIRVAKGRSGSSLSVVGTAEEL
jgi:exonuclease SbcC